MKLTHNTQLAYEIRLNYYYVTATQHTTRYEINKTNHLTRDSDGLKMRKRKTTKSYHQLRLNLNPCLIEM